MPGGGLKVFSNPDQKADSGVKFGDPLNIVGRKKNMLRMKAKKFKCWTSLYNPTGIIKAHLGDSWDTLGFLLQEVRLDPLPVQDFTHV